MTASFCRNENHDSSGRGATTFFFFLKHDRYSAPVIFFPLPAILTRSLAQTGLGGGRAGGGGEWLSPRERDQRKNYQGSKPGPGFGPVGETYHM